MKFSLELILAEWKVNEYEKSSVLGVRVFRARVSTHLTILT